MSDGGTSTKYLGSNMDVVSEEPKQKQNNSYCQTMPELMMIYMSNLFKNELMEILNKMQMDDKLKEEVSKKI